MSQHVPPWVYPIWDSVNILDLSERFLSHVREVFAPLSFQIFYQAHSFLLLRPLLRMFACLMLSCRRKWQPTPVFLPGESRGQGSLVDCRLWGHTESDTTEAT